MKIQQILEQLISIGTNRMRKYCLIKFSILLWFITLSFSQNECACQVITNPNLYVSVRNDSVVLAGIIKLQSDSFYLEIINLANQPIITNTGFYFSSLMPSDDITWQISIFNSPEVFEFGNYPNIFNLVVLNKYEVLELKGPLNTRRNTTDELALVSLDLTLAYMYANSIYNEEMGEISNIYKAADWRLWDLSVIIVETKF